MLHVVDRQPKRLVALQEAVEDRAPHRPQVRPASLGGDATVEVVPCGQGAQLLEQPSDRLGRLVQRLATRGSVECEGEPAEALRGLAARQVELAIAAILGGVEGHATTVFHRSERQAAAYLTHVTLLTAARGLCYGAPANFKLNQSRKA